MNCTEPEHLYTLIRLVRPAYRTLAATVDAELEGTGLSVGMRAVLEDLHDQGSRTVPQMARSLGVERQFTQRMVNEVRQLGLVERVSNPAHRRSWLIRLTSNGQEAIDAVLAREAHVMAPIAATLNPDELDTCIAVLKQVIDGFERRL